MIKRWNPWQRAFVTWLDMNPLWRQVYIECLVSFNESLPYFLWSSFSGPY